MHQKTQTRATDSSPAMAAVAEGMDRIARSAHSGIDAASDAAHPAFDRMVSGAHKVVENADEVATQATKALDKAGVNGQEMIASGTDYMRKHPLFTLGLAVTAGYVLSRLLASR
jgi:ElaB/YqjD/DUF883 family membrane-anchored ribosome-binding protein